MESKKNKLLAKYKVNKEKIPNSLFKYSSINEKFISALEEEKIENYTNFLRQYLNQSILV